MAGYICLSFSRKKIHPTRSFFCYSKQGGEVPSCLLLRGYQFISEGSGMTELGPGAGGCKPCPPPPVFGSSVNPISTRRADCAPLSDFRNFRHPWGSSENFRPRNIIRHRCILNGPVPVTVRGDVIENRLL